MKSPIKSGSEFRSNMVLGYSQVNGPKLIESRSKIVGYFLSKFASMVILVWVVAAAAGEDSSEMSFLERLRAQEEQEFLALENDIIIMSDIEYKAMLAKRMEGHFSEFGSTQKLAVVIDISDQMNQVFFQKRLGLQSEPKMLGILAVQTMLSDKPLSITSELALTRQESSDDGSTHYQKVEGSFTREAYESLLSSPKVTDVFIVTPNNTQTAMETFYFPKGRVLSAPVAKVYEDDFIDEGLYQEVMAQLDSVEIVGIAIGFHKEAGYYDPPTIEKEQARLKKIEEFLNDMQPLNIKANHKLAFSVYATVDREAAKAVFEDPRISYIRLGTSEGRFNQSY